MEQSRFWCIGHRGSPTFEPENTRPSFERALDHDGANGLELDLCVTKDGALVVWHDWSPHAFEPLCRETGLEPDVAFRPLPPQRGMLRRRVSDLYLDDVLKHFGYAPKDGPRERIDSARVMTWDEVCVLAASRAKKLDVLFLDIKVPADEVELVPDLVACVEKCLAERKVNCTIVYECAHRKVLAALKREAPHRAFSLDVGPIFGVRPGVRPYSAARRAIECKNAYATPERPRSCCWRPWNTYRRIAEHDMKLFEKHNAESEPAQRLRGIVGFTVNQECELEELVAMGMQGIQTDRPHVLSKLLRSGRRYSARKMMWKPKSVSTT
jgi:glycerophosphoryl diester phosphodiesterase